MKETSCIADIFTPKQDLSPWSDMLLSSGAELMDCPAGMVLCRSGEKCRYIYYLVHGLVKICFEKGKNASCLLGYHMPHAMFPADCLQADAVLNIGAEAITPLTILRFTPELLLRLCRSNAEFATDFALYVSNVLHIFYANLEKEGTGDPVQGMARFLCLYLKNSRLPGDFSCVPMTQESLSQAMGISRIQAAKLCTQLREMGVVGIGRRRITILDEKRLYELADIER